MMPGTSATPLLAAALAAATLAGCTPLPRLSAKWELVEAPSRPDGTFPNGKVYVAILNEEDRRSTVIAEVALARRKRSDWRAERMAAEKAPGALTPFQRDQLIFPFADGKPYELHPGWLLPIPTTILGDPARGCRIPIRLFIRATLRSRRVQVVEIPHPMPSTLSPAWLGPGGCGAGAISAVPPS